MSSNPNSSDFSYKKYSLEQLDNWVHDALNCEDLTPQDIYETIVICVDESVEYHKKYLTKSIELLSLLKGHRPINFDTTQNDWNDFWEENDCLEEHKQYTEEELNAMCDAASDKEKCREYNLREAEYYDKRAKLDAQTYSDRFKTQNGVSYNEYTKARVEANSAWNDGFTQKYYQDIVDKYEGKQDKVKKWVLPVEETKIAETDETEYFVSFPDDLLEAANLKEGDQVEWIDRGDGSYQLKKVKKPMTYEEAYAAGWTMTDDGIWWPPQDAKTVSMDEC